MSKSNQELLKAFFDANPNAFSASEQGRLYYEARRQEGAPVAVVARSLVKSDGSLTTAEDLTPASNLLAKRLTSDFSVTSNVTLAAVTDLSVPIVANQLVRLDYLLWLDDNAEAGNFQLVLVLPSGAAQRMSIIAWNDGNNGLSGVNYDLPTVIAALANEGAGGAFLHIVTTIKNGSTAGNVSIQFAQRLNNDSTVTMFADSSVIVFGLP